MTIMQIHMKTILLAQFLTVINTQSFMHNVLTNNSIFHDVENIVKHSLIISKWRVEI